MGQNKRTFSPEHLQKASQTPDLESNSSGGNIISSDLSALYPLVKIELSPVTMSESPHLVNDMDDSNNNVKELVAGPGLVQKPGERMKNGNVRKNASTGERMDCVRSYWNSMSSDRKKDFLRVKISDLKAHFHSSEDRRSTEVLNEPLCTCLSGAQKLREILEYLEEISQAFGLSKCFNDSNATVDSKSEPQRVDIIEKVTFSEDCSFLVLDEHFLPCKIPRSSCNEAVSCDSGAATSSRIIYENGVVRT